MKRFPSYCVNLSLLQGWEIIREIGKGGNGIVYHVYHAATDRNAALKWIHIQHREDDLFSNQAFLDAQPMLLTEINTMRGLAATPEVASIYDSAIQVSPDGNSMDAFILMELLTPLVERLRTNSFSVGQAARMVSDISKALISCHNAHIVHGDIKPENILCDQNGYKLSDFGVSLNRLRAFNRTPHGTQYFQPPEYRHSSQASHLGDIYSFGMMLYVIFNNGKIPWQTELNKKNEQEAWQKYCDMALLPSVSLPGPQFASPALSQVIIKSISFQAQDRYQSFKELSDAFSAAFSSLSDAERLMTLPYFQEEENSHSSNRIYLSTGRTTPRFDAPDSCSPSTEASNASEVTTSGFVIPQEKTAPAPVAKAKAAAEPELNTGKKSRKMIVWGICAIVLFLAVSLFLIFKPISYSPVSQIGAFDATVSIEKLSNNISFSAYVTANNTNSGYEVSATGNSISLKGLAPSTDYSLQLKIGRHSQPFTFTTKSVTPTRFQPIKQRIYTCETHLINQYGMNSIEKLNALQELTSYNLAVRNIPLSQQNISIILSCTAASQPFSENSESVMCLVLRTKDDVLTKALSMTPFATNDPRFYSLTDFTPLFDEYFTRYNCHPNGDIYLEVYWLNELIGSANMTLSGGNL